MPFYICIVCDIPILEVEETLSTQIAAGEKADTFALWSHYQLTDQSDYDCGMSITEAKNMSINQQEIQSFRYEQKSTECEVKEEKRWGGGKESNTEQKDDTALKESCT